MTWYKHKLWRFAIGAGKGGTINDADGTWVSVFGSKLYVNTKPISFTWKV